MTGSGKSDDDKRPRERARLLHFGRCSPIFFLVSLHAPAACVCQQFSTLRILSFVYSAACLVSVQSFPSVCRRDKADCTVLLRRLQPPPSPFSTSSTSSSRHLRHDILTSSTSQRLHDTSQLHCDAPTCLASSPFRAVLAAVLPCWYVRSRSSAALLVAIHSSLLSFVCSFPTAACSAASELYCLLCATAISDAAHGTVRPE